MNAVVMCDKDGCIGINDNQVIHLKSDLENFQSLTTGKVIVYGKNTLNTFPDKKPLKNRTNIIISSTLHDEDFMSIPNINIHVMLLNDIILLPKYVDTDDIYIIGGASIYNQMLPWINKIYMTYIDKSFRDIYTEIGKKYHPNGVFAGIHKAAYLDKEYLGNKFSTDATKRMDYCKELECDFETTYMIKIRK